MRPLKTTRRGLDRFSSTARNRVRRASHPVLGRVQVASETFSRSTHDRLAAIEVPWVRTCVEVFLELKTGDAPHMAAGVAYYAVLSLFPITIGLLAVLSIFSDSHEVQAFLQRFFDAYLPESVGFIDHISLDGFRFDGWVGVLGLISMIWLGSAMISALNRAINRAWGIHRDRSLLTDRPQAILLGVGLLLIFGASILATTLIASASELHVPALGTLGWLQFLAGVASLGLTFSSFLLLYYLLPNTKVRIRDVIPAAIVGAIVFELTKLGFVTYLDRFARFEEIYGSIASIVILMVWSYVSALILIAGAELAAVQIRAREGLPPGSPAVLGIGDRDDGPIEEQAVGVDA